MKAIVITPIGPLMAEPRPDCERTDEALAGMVVELGERRDEYVKATTEYGYTGYIPKACLLEDELQSCDWAGRTLRQVTRAALDVMAEPRVQSWTLETLPRGARLFELDRQQGWSRVELPDGRQGYARASGLGTRPETPWQQRDAMELRSDLARTALSYRGTQYRWGGKTPWGIDCSGLCSMAYLLQGIMIYRDADVRPGYPIHEIGMDRIGQGDLLFFPGHVALYLGDGRYVHATAAVGSDGVVVNSLRPGDPDFREDLFSSVTMVGSLF